MLKLARAAGRWLVLVAVAIVLAACGSNSTSPAPAAVVSITDATITEGATGQATAIIMSNPVGVTCRVAVTTGNLSAQAPGDYLPYRAAVFEIAGVPNMPVPLTAVDDLLVEGNETFTVSLALAPGADPRCQLGTSVATITIVSDDVASVISIADAAITEGSAGHTTISMSNSAGRTCAVTVTTANATALAPGDYVPYSGATLNLNAATVNLPLTAVDDASVESPETFTVTLALAPGADPRCQLGVNVATITINSDDATPAESVISIADATVREGAPARTTISMTNPTGVTCRVAVTTIDGTATAPGDYTAINGAIVELAGVPSTDLNLSVVDDPLPESNESFRVNLALAAGSDPRCRLGDSTAWITIVSDEVASVISIANATVTEGSPAQTTISMTNPAGTTCQLAVTTADGTATAPADYAALTGGLFTLSGVASDTLSFAVVDDLLVENAETFTVTLALAAGSDSRCQLGDSTATITIVSNDAASVVSIADATVMEGAPAQTTISMTNPTGVNCVLAVTSANGTAVAPGDYTAFVGSIFTMNGVASDTLGLPIVDDLLVEGNETFTVSLALAVGSDPRCRIGDGTATITIVSDDVASVVSIADATVTEGAPAQTTISMTNPTGVNCVLAVTSANGTAVAPGDYTAFVGSIFTMNGVASDTLGLPIVDDLLVEGNETFTVSLALNVGSDPRCRIGDGTATITIISND